MKRHIVFFFTLCICITSAMGSGIFINSQGHRQLGMAHTGTGLCLDGSSVFFNPGGIVMMNRNMVQVGTSLVFPYTIYSASSPSIYTEQMESQISTPTYIYAVGKWKREGRFAFGLGVNSPFGMNVKWPDNWKGRFISQENAMTNFSIQPTIGFRVTEQIGIGLGFVYSINSMLLREAIPVNGIASTEGEASLSGNGRSTSFNVGLYLRPTEQISLGISYRSALNTDIVNGQATFVVPNSLVDEYPSTTFNTRLKMPSVVNLGIGWRKERYALAFDVNIANWSGVDTMVINYTNNTATLTDRHSYLNYKNTFSARFGAEYLFNSRIVFRGGLFFDQSPVRDAYLSPAMPDNNRVGLSTGLGIKVIGNLSIDISYVWESAFTREGSFNEAGFTGIYKTRYHTTGIGLGYSF